MNITIIIQQNIQYSFTLNTKYRIRVPIKTWSLTCHDEEAFDQQKNEEV